MLRINYSDTVHLIASQNTSCDLITKTRGNTANIFTVKPLNTGHLRVLKYLSVIKRCPLLGGNFKKIVTFRSKCFDRYSWHVRYLGCPPLGVFTVYRNGQYSYSALSPQFFYISFESCFIFYLFFRPEQGVLQFNS